MKLENVVLKDLKTSGEIWRTIVELTNTPSRTGKIAILQKQYEKGNTLFRFTLNTVFNNAVNFGIVLKSDEWMGFVNTQSDATFDVRTIQFLIDLAHDEFTRKQALFEFEQIAKTLGYDSLRLLVAIINKDLQGAGINISTINKVFKGLIPAFPYMRCSLPTQVDLHLMEWDSGVLAQEKADGMFVNINVFGDGVKLLSRQGTEIPLERLGHDMEYLWSALPKGYQVHGEMLAKDPAGRIAKREIGNGIFNSICKGGSMPEGWTTLFRVWDAIPLICAEPKERYSLPYVDRFKELLKCIRKQERSLGVTYSNIEPIETKVCFSLHEAMAFYHLMLSRGKEGVVLKNPTAIWRDGTSKEQVKLKLELDCDLKVIGFEEGEGKFAGTLSSLLCESSDKMLCTSVSGFNDKMRKEIWENRSDYLDKIVTVRFNDIMQKEGEVASLFLPRFVEFRDDKILADSFRRIVEIKGDAVK